jgi:hypothetical protein
MREYSFKINPQTLNGLRLSDTNPRNTGNPIKCYNILAGRQSLEPLELIEEAIYQGDPLPAVEFPFPQMIFGKYFSLICTKTKIFEINRYTDPWTATLVLDFSLVSGSSLWDENNTWHFADFHSTIIATNAAVMFWYDPILMEWKRINENQPIRPSPPPPIPEITSTFPLFETVCRFKDRVIFGNINDTKSNWYNCDEKFVCWSKFGQIVSEPDTENTSGFIPMLFDDVVLKVLPLGNNIIVYGKEGICLLRPADKYFAIKKIDNYGLLNRDSVNGDDRKHIFLDSRGVLKYIDSSLSIKLLGYREFFESFDHAIINFDKLNDRFYIDNGEENYILTKYGLTSSYQKLVSGANTNRFFVGNIVYDGLPDLNVRITTDVFDINHRNQKTIESIEAGSNYSGKCFVSIDYRYDVNEPFKTTKEIILNKKGIVRLPCAGVEFRINLRFENFIDANLDYLLVKFKNTDKMNLRGLISAIESI